MLDWKKSYNLKNSLISVAISLIILLFIYLLISFALFPNQIQLLKGQDNKLNFSIPFNATINPSDLEVIQVNNTLVSENISIKLNEELVIKSEELGTAHMTVSAFGIPVKNVNLNVVPNTELVPLGMTVGIKINTDGVMVLGTGYVNDINGNVCKPSAEILKAGDLILTANGQKLTDKLDLLEIIENSDTDILMTVDRDGEIIKVSIKPVKGLDTTNKIGVWVRDSTQGIGTITYYNPATDKFGALGHGILDVDTKDLMSVKDGDIMKSEILSVKKGKKGAPGELVGEIQNNNVFGKVKLNTNYGIYGFLDEETVCSEMPLKPIPIALQEDVHEGPATILSNVEGTDVKSYDIYIESVSKNAADNSKGMIMRITDTELLSKTNGIVQGMSGSPIIQDEKLIGAVTHVFVQDPTKGYGIFIENMLKQENSI